MDVLDSALLFVSPRVLHRRVLVARWRDLVLLHGSAAQSLSGRRDSTGALVLLEELLGGEQARGDLPMAPRPLPGEHVQDHPLQWCACARGAAPPHHGLRQGRGACASPPAASPAVQVLCIRTVPRPDQRVLRAVLVGLSRPSAVRSERHVHLRLGLGEGLRGLQRSPAGVSGQRVLCRSAQRLQRHARGAPRPHEQLLDRLVHADGGGRVHCVQREP
eukprot:Amastigsp_a176390_40.p3 type:complete len:218 gc:universal Amastigsp_a176390_40:2579-1926(-)